MTGPRTDDDWRALLAGLAHHLLEVERGLRPATQLESLLSEPAFGLWQRQHRNGRLTGGPVSAADIGPVRFTRTDRDVVASIPTATTGGRWGALSLRLHATVEGRWQVVDLYRVVPGRHYSRQRQPRPTPPARSRT